MGVVNKHWDSRQPLSLTFVLSYSYEYCTGMYVYRTVLVGAPTTPEDEENASPDVAPSGRKVSAASFFTPRVAQVSPVRRQQDRLLLHVSLKRIIRMKMNSLSILHFPRSTMRRSGMRSTGGRLMQRSFPTYPSWHDSIWAARQPLQLLSACSHRLGIAFSDRRKSSKADFILELFTKLNIE